MDSTITTNAAGCEVLPDSDDESSKEMTLMDHVNAAKAAGNEAFRAGDFDTALQHYGEAIDLCPDESPLVKAVLYANRAAAFLQLDDAPAAVEDCTAAIELDPDYRKAYLRRATAYTKFDERPRYEEAVADLKHLVSLDPPDKEAARMLPDLEKKAEAERERLKTEMMGQLKDLGNSFLGWFGLSTDNFKAEKDPSTGQYSIQFVQNAAAAAAADAGEK